MSVIPKDQCTRVRARVSQQALTAAALMDGVFRCEKVNRRPTGVSLRSLSLQIGVPKFVHVNTQQLASALQAAVLLYVVTYYVYYVRSLCLC